jgi:hypothetical protein
MSVLYVFMERLLKDPCALLEYQEGKTCMMQKIDGLATWHKFVNDKDEQALATVLAEDVTFYSPVAWRPKEGKAITMLHLSCAARVFQDFIYEREFVGDHAAVLQFSARVGSLQVKGVDILQFNAEGRITNFEVMVRPASGLQALGDAMALELAANAPRQTGG